MADSIDTTTPYSPGWYLKLLMGKLHDRRTGRNGRQAWSRTSLEPTRVRPPLILLDDYWRGDPPLHEDIHRGWAEPFRRYYRMGRLHVADLLVSPVSNRMGIQAFRTAAADDELGDAAAQDLMTANNLTLVARDVHDYALALGTGYTMVTPPDGERDYSLITAESPLFTIVAHDPATGRRLAALKVFRDEFDTMDLAYLFLPGELWVAGLESPNSTLRTKGRFAFSAKWQWIPDLFDDVPGNEIPIVRLENRRGVGEFEHHLDTLDRINDKLFNEWWISKLQAFKQRAVMLKDEDLDEDYENDGPPTEEAGDVEERNQSLFDRVARGELDGIFTSSPDSLWQLPADSEIWESTPPDIRQLTESVKEDLKNLAAASTSPLYIMAPDSASGSASGADLLREEHGYKVLDRRDRAQGTWAETMAMAFLFQGDVERADRRKLQTVWGPVDRYGLQERSAAAAALAPVLPREAIWTDVLQYTPAEVQDRMRALRARDTLFDGQPADQQPAGA